MIPLFKPCYGPEEVEAVAKVLESGWSGLGPVTEQFEEKFASYVGAKYAVAVNSCTAALHLAVNLIQANSKYQIIVPTVTFVSTAHAAIYGGYVPIFCDVDSETLSLDWDKAKSLTTTATAAIIYVNYGGQVLPIPRLDIPVIYDCAHSCGSEFSARDKICCWSFHSVKNLSCGDGGMITTDDPSQAAKLKRLRWLGIDKGTWDRAKTSRYIWDYNVTSIGKKYHMNDITAAIGLAQLKKMPELQKQRTKLALLYDKLLEGRKTPLRSEGNGWHLYVIKSKRRDGLHEYLKNRNISTGVHYKPIHLYDCYRAKTTLPVAEQTWKEILTLPMFPSLKEEQVFEICQHINTFEREQE